MAKCGTYSVPNGISGQGEPGSADYGLDLTFYRAVQEFLQYDLMPAGFKVSLGEIGYMSRSEAVKKAASGKPGYLKQIRLFSYGLGWEVVSISKDGKSLDSALSSINYGGFLPAMLARGITYVEYKENGVVKLRYFRPLGVNVRNTGSGGLEQEGGDPGHDSTSYAGDSGAEGGGSSDSSGSSSDASISSASYFFANQFNAVVDVAESYMLQGERALANDVDLWTYVKKACNASLRTCSSDPDGNFIAWYPDYFGKAGKTPKIIIKDVELKDLTITQSDAEFYSHVFCPGVTASGTTVDKWLTTGVVSIEGPAIAEAASGAALQGTDLTSDEVSPLLDNILNIPDGEEWRYTPKELYRRYGARPATTPALPTLNSGVLIEDTEDLNNQDSDEAPNHILPYLYALYNFMYHWAQQYKGNLQITFMPELFPGMRIKVESLDIEFYVQGVSHSMNYTSGFTTNVEAICPVGSLVSGMVASSGGE